MEYELKPRQCIINEDGVAIAIIEKREGAWWTRWIGDENYPVGPDSVGEKAAFALAIEKLGLPLSQDLL